MIISQPNGGLTQHPHALSPAAAHSRGEWNFDQKPFMVIWEVTRACALVCKHCRAEAQGGHHPQELTTGESLRLLDQIARAQPEILVLTGGDPMQRKDLHDLIRHAVGSGLHTALSPSATPLLLREDFGKLKELGISAMSISIDGPDELSHNTFRGVKKTWQWTMEALEKARVAGIPVQINTTMTRDNIARLDELQNLVRTLNPMTWSLFILVPTGRGQQRDMLTADELEQLFERLFDYSLTVPFHIKTTEGQHYRRVAIQQARKRELRPPRMVGLNDGKGFVFVSHVGDIYPSGFLPLPVANCRTEDLLSVYQEHPTFKRLRTPSQLGGKCGVCEFNSICGGSRARAYATSEDWMAAEPLCSYQPPRWRERQNSSSEKSLC